MAFISLPLLQVKLNLFSLKPLKGDVSDPPQAHWTFDGWISSDYQEEKETYLNAMFGFRSMCVRINNQIDYSLFKQLHANGVIIGKQNYLYEENYIKAYHGEDYLGRDSIEGILNRLKFISDTLKTLNKQLILVFAAGKGSFYPEYFPDGYSSLPAVHTNYKDLSSGAEKIGLEVIDFNDWFVKHKYTSKYPLYPQHGIHWSQYGMVLAADSILKKIEFLRHIDLPDLSYQEVEVQKPHDGDADIGEGMNLLVGLKSFDMGYPKLMITHKEKAQANLLVISDSFYWGIYNFGFSNCFKESHFWYYNKQVYPESAEKQLLTEDLNVGKEILKQDVIILMATEATLKTVGWGFIEKADLYFKGQLPEASPEDLRRNRQIKEWKNYIRTDKKWMKDIERRAGEKHISPDSALTLDAIWQVKQKE